jgi:hypothetical protein
LGHAGDEEEEPAERQEEFPHTRKVTTPILNSSTGKSEPAEASLEQVTFPVG